MAISNAAYLKTFHDKAKALGDKVISSDFTFEIEGFEDSYLLCKQAPWPILASAGEIEVPNPLGGVMFQPQQIQTNQQSPVSFQETVAGSVSDILNEILVNGGTFKARVYEGTPQKHLRVKTLRDCFFQMDTPDRDWENKSQVLLYSGTLFYHYFGEEEKGNSANYK